MTAGGNTSSINLLIRSFNFDGGNVPDLVGSRGEVFADWDTVAIQIGDQFFNRITFGFAGQPAELLLEGIQVDIVNGSYVQRDDLRKDQPTHHDQAQ